MLCRFGDVIMLYHFRLINALTQNLK